MSQRASSSGAFPDAERPGGTSWGGGHLTSPSVSLGQVYSDQPTYTQFIHFEESRNEEKWENEKRIGMTQHWAVGNLGTRLQAGDLNPELLSALMPMHGPWHTMTSQSMTSCILSL